MTHSPRRAVAKNHEHTTTGSAVISLDEEARTLFFIGPVEDTSCGVFLQAFHLLDRSKGKITIVMNSRGGEESCGFAIYDVLKNSPNMISIECYGAVQSIAALILQGANERLMSQNCRFMIHNGHVQLPGQIYQGTFGAMAKESAFATERYIEILASTSGSDIDTIRDMCNQETYLSATEAVSAGFADRIIEQKVFQAPLKKPTKRKRKSK